MKNIYDFNLIEKFYNSYSCNVDKARKEVGHPFTLTEKILYTHMYGKMSGNELRRGVDYTYFSPDRVAMQDATAQMALLQFMNSDRTCVAVPASIHCDHLVQASEGRLVDLETAHTANEEVYDFLQSAAYKYGISFWGPGSGIIHQIVLENYAFPGGLMIGTDSHTPNAGGLGMLAIGVGGADAVDVLTGQAWELRMPRIIGVKLSGELSPWVSPKDVILKILGILTVKGATNSVLEYWGEGTRKLSCTGKATICNMGAEAGATTSVFPYDEKMAEYLIATGRNDVALLANRFSSELCADEAVYLNPEAYYDKVIEINLSELKPHINGPFTPDAACPVEDMAERVKANGYPDRVEAVLIGSCTNSSYEDLRKAANVVERALAAGMKIKSQLLINPGSEKIYRTVEQEGILDIFEKVGGVVMANACGPCIGQWKRKLDDSSRSNTIVTTFNRNFAKRADGNPNTYAFIASPEVAVGYAFTGFLSSNPCKCIPAPIGEDLPPMGFVQELNRVSSEAHPDSEVKISPDSQRLQRLNKFPAWSGTDWMDVPLLIKVKGKCTTDHISMAGPWLKYRGHLANISRNLLMGAVNAFNEQCNVVRNELTGQNDSVSSVAQAYQAEKGGSFIVAEENYGEGSSREHAAMEPRYLGVKFVLAKSFARIHETNLKKQGVLALTFENPSDYGKIRQGDSADVLGLKNMAVNSKIQVVLHHLDGTEDVLSALHSYNEVQIEWFRAGAALNVKA